MLRASLSARCPRRGFAPTDTNVLRNFEPPERPKLLEMAGHLDRMEKAVQQMDQVYSPLGSHSAELVNKLRCATVSLNKILRGKAAGRVPNARYVAGVERSTSVLKG
eukprot:Hpha_TRINITY_DN16191_c0_g2::TRINITY_DN16191_c0_g2_i1::g.4901::m.4901